MRPSTLALLVILAIPARADVRLDANKDLARRVFSEVLTKGDFALGKELYAPDFVNHGLTTDVTLERDHEAARGWLVAFPDLRVEPEIVLAENDLVAVLWRASGTNRGAANGIPATGRRMNTTGMTVWRIVSGRVQEEWSAFSELHVMRQLGLLADSAPIDAAQPESRGEIAPRASSRAVRGRNRALTTSVLEQALGKGKVDLFQTVYARSFVHHGLAGDTGVDAEVRATRDMRETTPDLRLRVVLTVAEGDLVASVYTAEGTSTDAAAGSAGVTRMIGRSMSIMRVTEGKIAEAWSVDDAQWLRPFPLPNAK